MFLQLLFSLDQWASEMQRLEILESEQMAEGALNKHAELMQHMKNTVEVVLHRGEHLQQVFADTGVDFLANAHEHASVRIETLLESLHKKELDLEDVAEQKRVHIEQVRQLVHFKKDAQQVRVTSAS